MGNSAATVPRDQAPSKSVSADAGKPGACWAWSVRSRVQPNRAADEDADKDKHNDRGTVSVGVAVSPCAVPDAGARPRASCASIGGAPTTHSCRAGAAALRRSVWSWLTIVPECRCVVLLLLISCA